MTRELTLHPDRFFDSDPGIRRIARQIHDETRDLPIISPHGHVDPGILAENSPFPEPAALIVIPDHYILRMLYSQGIPLESLGLADRQTGVAELDPRAIWRAFAGNYHLFLGTPSGAWVNHTLHEVFGIGTTLSEQSADSVYDAIAERLASPEFRPRALYERFRIEVLATTDAATDDLRHHLAIRQSRWGGRVIPTFRPDTLFQIARDGWTGDLSALAALDGRTIGSYSDFIDAIQSRRAFFREMGGTATDHGVEVPLTVDLPEARAAELFNRGMQGRATPEDQHVFEAHMLVQMARMSTVDGLVMQLHAGALRNHNRLLYRRFGPNIGADIPVATEYTRNLQVLLNEYGDDPRFRIILFTLDESTYARELAPLAGHYPAVRLGPPWWFHDSIEGMRRYREQVTETAGIYNTVGFNDDTRAFCSIPARHDLARRMDANWLAGLVARHIVDLTDARQMARALAYDLAKDGYRL